MQNEDMTSITPKPHSPHNSDIYAIQINMDGRQKARSQINRIWLRRRVMKSLLHAFEQALFALNNIPALIIVAMRGNSLAKKQGYTENTRCRPQIKD
jgi:hypothetical protein